MDGFIPFTWPLIWEYYFITYAKQNIKICQIGYLTIVYHTGIFYLFVWWKHTSFG